MRQRTLAPSGERPTKRGAAVLVEMAAVVVVFLMLLFGVLEYCRFVFFKQLITNAAREGARFAVVNVPTLSTVQADTVARVAQVMASMDKQLPNYKVQVYQADVNGNNIGIPEAAGFGQYIAVEISGDYSPILPSFLFMGKTIKIQSKSMMYSEAN
jgi:hypothetical protein